MATPQPIQHPAIDAFRATLQRVPLGGAMAWWVWSLAVAFVVYLFSVQTAYSIVSLRIQDDLGLSIEQVGRIAAVYTWLFALCQFFSGALLDRLGSRRVLPAAIGLVTLGVFVFAGATTFEMSLLAQAILALGACAGFVGAGYIGGQWFGMAKFSFMFGLVQFAASIASAFNQNVIGRALHYVTWRELFTAVGAFGVGLLALGVLFIRNPVRLETGLDEGIRPFVADVARDVITVGRMPHVWAASLFGALSFGAILSLGVVWGPKLVAVRAMDPDVATRAASLIWLGLAAGCLIVPRWSDRVQRRKPPIAVTLVVQIAALAGLLYLPELGSGMAMALCFAFGLGGAAHMLAFSTTADIVAPKNIGTSAAIVNGLMFLVGGVMIARPGVRTGWALAGGLEPQSLAVAQYAVWPLLAALICALLIAVLMKETYPRSSS